MAARTGNDNDNSLEGTAEADTISGLGGDDTLRGWEGDDTIYGGTGDDRLLGDGGSDSLFGGAGNDLFFALRAGAPHVDGGAGRDVLVFGLYAPDVQNLVIDMAAGTAVGDGLDATFEHIESVRGTYYSDRITGSAGDDELSGGLAGDDTIDGGAGFDMVGRDWTSGLDGLVVDLALGTASGLGWTASLSNVEGVIGLPWDDWLSGDDGDNRFDPNVGADTVIGGLGNDLVAYEFQLVNLHMARYRASVLIDLERGRAVNIDDTVDELSGIEQALGGSGSDTLIGSAADNVLMGNSGNDLLRGHDGDDVLWGFHDGRAHHDGGPDGNDTLAGGAGADTMHGGLGDDTCIVTSGDLVVERANGGVDTVQSAIDWTLGPWTEVLSLRGSAGLDGTGNWLDNTLNGNAADNVLSGLDGADLLSGAYGNDVLRGGPGDDTLSGGPGVDRLAGGSGADHFRFDVAGLAGPDQIVLFESGVDRIELDGSLFGLGDAGPLADTMFVAGATAADADDRILYDASSGTLAYDGDGSGSGAPFALAQLGSGTALVLGDLWVV